MRGDMMFSLSGKLATMAYGLPYTIAAAVAYPGRQVVCFVGDGGFTMLMGEMATCRQVQAPVKIIIIKNNTLGQIKWEQMVFWAIRNIGCDLQPIDFAAFAGLRRHGFTIEDPAQCGKVCGGAGSTRGRRWSRRWSIRTSRPCRQARKEAGRNFAEVAGARREEGGDIVSRSLPNTIREVGLRPAPMNTCTEPSSQ